MYIYVSLFDCFGCFSETVGQI